MLRHQKDGGIGSVIFFTPASMTDALVSITISYVGESAGELDGWGGTAQRECVLLARLIVGLDGRGSWTWRVRGWLEQRPEIKVVVVFAPPLYNFREGLLDHSLTRLLYLLHVSGDPMLSHDRKEFRKTNLKLFYRCQACVLNLLLTKMFIVCWLFCVQIEVFYDWIASDQR
jgi:hypothetical protein